jgi:hypothetical protein
MNDADSALQPETKSERRLMALLLCIASGENAILLQATLFQSGAHIESRASSRKITLSAIAKVCTSDHEGETETCFLQARSNDGNNCGSLMQCFISYSYRGFIMSSLDNYLPEPTIAENWGELLPHDVRGLERFIQLLVALFPLVTQLLRRAPGCCGRRRSHC